MNQFTEKAFESLTIACNTISLHSTDEDFIKVTLRVLHKKKVGVDINELEHWLICNDWKEKPTKSVVSWAEAVENGRRIQLKHKSMVPTEKEIWQKLTTP